MIAFRTVHWWLLTGLLGFGLVAPAVWAASEGLPEVPADENFIQDYAGILPNSVERRVGELQRRAFEDHDTAIVVVTIGSMADYGQGGGSIERFAHRLFDKWEIGKREDGVLHNKGVLLLVSVGDRKARIELGADWGRRWDRHAAKIMNQRIVPAFKEGDYGKGVLAGVEAISEMARQGPEAEPSTGLTETLKSKPVPANPMPLWGVITIAGVGVLLIVLSFVFPQHRKGLLMVGIGLVIGAFVVWILLIALSLMLGNRKGSSKGGFSSGGFSGGGFSSGGFSGGGGATGSW